MNQMIKRVDFVPGKWCGSDYLIFQQNLLLYVITFVSFHLWFKSVEAEKGSGFFMSGTWLFDVRGAPLAFKWHKYISALFQPFQSTIK